MAIDFIEHGVWIKAAVFGDESTGPGAFEFERLATGSAVGSLPGRGKFGLALIDADARFDGFFSIKKTDTLKVLSNCSKE